MQEVKSLTLASKKQKLKVQEKARKSPYAQAKSNGYKTVKSILKKSRENSQVTSPRPRTPAEKTLKVQIRPASRNFENDTFMKVHVRSNTLSSNASSNNSKSRNHSKKITPRQKSLTKKETPRSRSKSKKGTPRSKSKSKNKGTPRDNYMQKTMSTLEEKAFRTHPLRSKSRSPRGGSLKRNFDLSPEFLDDVPEKDNLQNNVDRRYQT